MVRTATIDLSRLTDTELVAMASSDLGAYGELVRRHQRFVYGAALRITRSPSLAEDIAQETFIRAHRAIHAFRGDASVRSWLYRIATNLAKNAVTRSREQPSAAITEGATSDDPGHLTERLAMTDALATAITALPEHLRTPLVLREYEGMSYDEIARATGLPLNTVRTRLLRAREALRIEMEAWR